MSVTGVPGRLVATLDQVLHEDEPQDVVEAVLVDRDARVLLLAEERTEIARGSRPTLMATMSGRGVITSRTSRSLKSTIDRSSSRPSPSLIGSVAAVPRRVVHLLDARGRLLRRHRAVPPAGPILQEPGQRTYRRRDDAKGRQQ